MKTETELPPLLEHVVDLMVEAGIQFFVRGVMEVPAAEIREYLLAPEEWQAFEQGVTLEDYRAWLTSTDNCDSFNYGRPLCAATLRSGQRCKNGVAPTGQGVRTYASLHRKAFCHVHARRQNP